MRPVLVRTLTCLLSIGSVMSCGGETPVVDAAAPDAGAGDGGVVMDGSTADVGTDVGSDAGFDAVRVDSLLLDVPVADVPFADVPVVGLAAPRPVAPLPSSLVNARRPTFRWVLAPGSEGARVDLCRDRAMTTGCLSVEATGATTAPGSDLATGTWFWRLRPRVDGVTGAATSATWRFRVGAATSGGSSPPTFDANGDGFDDLAVGDPSSNAVYVYLGGATGLHAPHTATLVGAFGDTFGASASGAGDVNGDGFSDLLVPAAGAVRVFLGTSAGTSTAPSQTLGTTGVGAAAGAGDLDGDGYGDVIVGAATAASVYYGSPSGLVVRSGALGCAVMGGCGAIVAGAGDVNSDGFGDALMGSGNRIELHLGGAAGLAAGAAVTLVDGTGGGFNSAGGLGDVNGDGLGDVVATSNTLSSGALVYHGSVAGLSAASASNVPTPATVVRPSRAGDVNGDGFADLLMPTRSGTQVYAGGSTGVRSVPLSNSNVTYSNAATAGDFNGDGYADLVTNAESNWATISVFSGSASGPSETATVTLSEPEPWGARNAAVAEVGWVSPRSVLVFGITPVAYYPEGFTYYRLWPHALGVRFGEALASVGNVRAAEEEFLIGAPGANAAYLVSFEGRLLAGLSGPAGSDFGAAVAAAGDLNNDGWKDVLVGAPGAARAYVYLGGASFPGTPIELAGAAGSHFGRVVSMARDLNGDGFGDVAVASDGRVDVFMGRAAGITTTAAASLTGPPGSRFGESVAGAGDLNQDGLRDLVVGAPGADAAYVYYGRATTLSTTPSVTLTGVAGSEFGATVLGAGDVDRNGSSDVVVGAPNRSIVHFYGSAAGPTNTPIYSLSGAASSRFGAVLARTYSASRSSEFEVGVTVVGAPGAGQPNYYTWGCDSPGTNCRPTAGAPLLLPGSWQSASAFGLAVAAQ